jgi:hypothetical protein
MVSLFEPIESAWDCPPLTDEMILEAQRRLDVVLPASYIEVLRVRNGGLLRRCEHPIYLDIMKSNICVSMLYGIGVDDGIDSTDGTHYFLSKFLAHQWSLPEGSVVFSKFGHVGLSFAYHQAVDKSDPPVVFHYAECYPDVITVPVAPSFKALISALVIPSWMESYTSSGPDC